MYRKITKFYHDEARVYLYVYSTFCMCFIKDKKHCILEMSPSAIERADSWEIRPIIILLKFKSVKQIRHVYIIKSLTALAMKFFYVI